jgi:hypothetical protein
MKSLSVRLLYLYLFSFVGLLITVIGIIRLVDLGLKVYVFQGADQYDYYAPVKIPESEVNNSMTPEQQKELEKLEQKRQEDENKRNRQREFSGALSMIVVGIPLYLYHWKTIQKEK